jgi:hypothetical protein
MKHPHFSPCAAPAQAAGDSSDDAYRQLLPGAAVAWQPDGGAARGAHTPTRASASLPGQGVLVGFVTKTQCSISTSRGHDEQIRTEKEPFKMAHNHSDTALTE